MRKCERKKQLTLIKQDTYVVWERGLFINRMIDTTPDGGQYEVQSLLHLGHTLIGRLPSGVNYLSTRF